MVFCALCGLRGYAQAIEAQQIAKQKASPWALSRGHFAQKINANLSQLFENTTFQVIFFAIFLLTTDFCHSRAKDKQG